MRRCLGSELRDHRPGAFKLRPRRPVSGSTAWTRREIGAVDAISLAAARAKAREWIELAGQGKDPRAEEERARREQARKTAHTFAAVAEDFIAERVIGSKPAHPIQRKHKWVARTIRDPFTKAWGDKPIADIEREDVLTLIKAKARVAPAEARVAAGHHQELVLVGTGSGLRPRPLGRFRCQAQERHRRRPPGTAP